VNADGSLTGIDVDMLELLNKKLGTHIELRLGRWADMVAMAQAREIDGLTTSAELEKRKPHFLFSKVYLAGYKCIFTRTREDFGINGLQDLEGHRVDIHRGNAFLRNLLKGIPRVEIVEADGLHALMELLLKGQVDAAIESTNLFYEMFSHRIGGIKIQKIIADRPLPLVYSIRRDWPQFVSIINKGLDAISEAEMIHILKKYAMDILPQVKPSFVLNDREKAWLAEEHTVRVGVSDLPPFIFAQKGQRPVGIAIDILDLIAQGTGLHLRYDDSSYPWDEAIQIMSSPGGPDLQGLADEESKTMMFRSLHTVSKPSSPGY
jgi:two-component system sensor histidine kinase EvgS